MTGWYLVVLLLLSAHVLFEFLYAPVLIFEHWTKGDFGNNINVVKYLASNSVSVIFYGYAAYIVVVAWLKRPDADTKLLHAVLNRTWI